MRKNTLITATLLVFISGLVGCATTHSYAPETLKHVVNHMQDMEYLGKSVQFDCKFVSLAPKNQAIVSAPDGSLKTKCNLRGQSIIDQFEDVAPGQLIHVEAFVSYDGQRVIILEKIITPQSK